MRSLRIPVWLTLGVLMLTVRVASAQPAANANGAAQVVSPEVNPDSTVTYRLFAPNVTRVTVTGDLMPGNSLMRKDAAGVWSFTSPVMPAGIFGYFFNVDGVRMVDPSNLYSLPGGRFLKSYVEVRGDGKQFWSHRDVPHGELHEIWYQNPSLGSRHMIVYTPPGYSDRASTTYPTVYLYSGAGDNETYWTKIGRAHFIMDNLIADGVAKPAIVVMPYGHTVIPAPADGQEDTSDGVYSVRAIERDLIGSVIPTIERRFRVGRTPKDRAIFGFSMGGYLAPTIGLNHPELFGYVAGSSADYREALPSNFKRLVDQLALAKREQRFVGIIVGQSDNGAVPSKRASDYLSNLGVRNEWSQPAGGTHTWHSWRGYFRDLMANKFFVDRPYENPRVGEPAAPAAAR